MEMNQYQSAALKFAIHPHGEITLYPEQAKKYGIESIPIGLLYTACGLGEVGEVQGKIKKIVRDANGHVTLEVREAIAAELGDVLWYVADMCSELGLTLGNVAEWNIAKLQSRANRGKLQGSGDTR